MINTQYNFIEVCAGAGGLSCGLIKAGFMPILLNDNNKDCCKTLELNHPGSNIKLCSLIDLEINEYIDKIDLLTGGVPCQSYSQAGKRKGLADPRGDLMLKFIELLTILKPKMFMIENVKGLVTHNNGETIKYIIDTINKCELYNIEYQVLNSFNYNVPQKRERIFIIGVLKILNIKYMYPKKNDTFKVLKDVLYDVPLSTGSLYSSLKLTLYKHIPQGGCWINLPIELQKSYLGKSFNSGGGKRGILYRLSMDKPCLTLLCSPSQKQTERCHPIEDRPLRIQEYARIQTFDDDYKFYGSLTSQYKQIGNAVPVELARQIGISLIECLKKMKLN